MDRVRGATPRQKAALVFLAICTFLAAFLIRLGERDADPKLMLVALLASAFAWLFSAFVPFWFQPSQATRVSAMANAFAASTAAIGTVASTRQAWAILLA
jgi:hypothetical protein